MGDRNVSRGGFDIGLMSTAMSIRNETNDRNAREAADGRGGRGHSKKQNPGKV